MTASPPVRPQRHDDADLVARFRAGDTAAFDQLVEAHQQRITHLVYRLLGTRDEVQDMVQDVFLCVLENLSRFRGESKLSTWLTTIAVNRCRSHHRRRLLRPRNLWRAVQTLAAPREQTPPAEAAEIRGELRRAVRRLPPKYREPIVLRYFEEMSAGEIGQVLGISTNNVEVRLTRARHKLRETLSIRMGEQ